jgi:transposase InsO family protein
MDIHKNARLTPLGREALARKVVSQGATLNAAAAEFKVSTRTAAKWVQRYRTQGSAGLGDRSSRPHRLPRLTSQALVDQVQLLRRQRWTGCRIARTTGLSPATVSRILRRLGLHRLRLLEPALPVLRYEYPDPGGLLHLDIKKLARIGCIGHRIHGDRRRHSKGAGWEYVHVAIDDHSRIAFLAVFPDQKGPSAAAFLQAAIAYYARLGIRIQRLLTDNGPCYKSHAFLRLRQAHALQHLFTKPFTPRTNGKAERFIQTALREWAYARAYNNSVERALHLPHWLHEYNWHRPHASLNGSTPISRSGLDRNNLLIHHS